MSARPSLRAPLLKTEQPGGASDGLTLEGLISVLPNEHRPLLGGRAYAAASLHRSRQGELCQENFWKSPTGWAHSSLAARRFSIASR